MVDYINQIVSEEEPVCKELIISGGVKTFLDGYYLIKRSNLSSVYGMASAFLKYAREDYAQLRDFVYSQVKGLEMAEAYLTLKE
jgi:isopentenyl-diphosphate delta-isomerase